MSSKAARRRARRARAVEKAARHAGVNDGIRSVAAPSSPINIRGQGGVLDRQAVANGWVSAATPEKLKEVLSRQIEIATAKEQDARDSSRAAGIVVKCVGQIMEQEKRDNSVHSSDEFSPVAVPASPVQVNVQVNQPSHITHEDEGIMIVQRTDFYRNNAHQREAAIDVAKAAEASTSGTHVAVSVQDADLRAAVRKNSNGSHGHAGGPRSNGHTHNGNGYHENGNGHAGSH